MSGQSSTSSEDTVVGPEERGERNPRARHTRSGASRRQQQESTLGVALGQMQLLTDPSAMKAHEAILYQMVGMLELDHLEYVEKGGLDIKAGPEATYVADIKAKVDRAIVKHRRKLHIDTDLVDGGRPVHGCCRRGSRHQSHGRRAGRLHVIRLPNKQVKLTVYNILKRQNPAT